MRKNSMFGLSPSLAKNYNSVFQFIADAKILANFFLFTWKKRFLRPAKPTQNYFFCLL
eukprot:UN07915